MQLLDQVYTQLHKSDVSWLINILNKIQLAVKILHMQLFLPQAESMTVELHIRPSIWKILFCTASALVSRLIHNGSEVILTGSAKWHQRVQQLGIRSKSSLITSVVVVCTGNLSTVRIRLQYLQLNLKVPKLSARQLRSLARIFQFHAFAWSRV